MMTTINGYRPLDTGRKHELLYRTVRELEDERRGCTGLETSRALSDYDDDTLFSGFRAAVNTRPPKRASERFLSDQDTLLKGLIAEKGVATIDAAYASPRNERMLLWRGDITTLAVDAIVNAANSQMLGCWVPGHFCIDNAIHTYAGVQLRCECAELMAAQGHEEPTGRAKITHAWNLPAHAVVHTVGPIAAGRVTDRQRSALESCYRSCLDLAHERGLRTIAFCCISTGVFGFPADEAARIAVSTVSEWLAGTAADVRVVFDVFIPDDEQRYRNLLGIA